MSEIKPTPGPWYVLGDDELSGIKFIEISRGDFGPDYRSIAWVGNQPDGISDEDRANANLVAAAPDLLRSLKEISDMFMGRPDMVRAPEPLRGFAENAIFDRAAQVIAKAEGRS